jgi:outer membrane receptor protein involved in Fe transport
VRLRGSGGVGAVARGGSGSGAPSVALYVNGVRVDTVSLRQTLYELDLADIEAIEVYRGVSELPLEAMGNACAAIFVWTRFGPG